MVNENLGTKSISKFSYEPSNGLLDRNRFPTQPQSEEDARGQFMTLFNQVKDYNNNVIFNEITSNINSINEIKDSLGSMVKITENDDAICLEIVGGFKIQCGLASNVSNGWVGKGYPVPFTKKIYGIGAMAKHETASNPLIVRDDPRLDIIQFKNSNSTPVNASWYAIGI